MPHVKSGRLAALAVTTPKRIPPLPEVPTIADTVPSYEVLNWQGIVVPARTPAAIIQTLHQKLVVALKMPGMNEALTVQGFDANGGGPEEFGALIKSELARYAKIVKIAGIRAE